DVVAVVACVVPLPLGIELTFELPPQPASRKISATIGRRRLMSASAYDRRVPLSPLLTRYDHVVCDMDGCLWVRDELTPRAGRASAAIRGAGKGLAFVTNNPRRAAEDYVAKMWRLGIQASTRDVVTVGGATQHLLAETRRGRTAFVIGSDTLRKHVADAG